MHRGFYRFLPCKFDARAMFFEDMAWPGVVQNGSKMLPRCVGLEGWSDGRVFSQVRNSDQTCGDTLAVSW